MSNKKCTCGGTGYIGIFHPVTLELTVIKCSCNKRRKKIEGIKRF